MQGLQPGPLLPHLILISQCKRSRQPTVDAMQTGEGTAPLPSKEPGSRRMLRPFLAPPRVDLDLRGGASRRTLEAKGFLLSPYSPVVHAAFARHALHWNKGLFPRVARPIAEKAKGRRQSSLAEERLLAVLVLQHGSNFEARRCFVPDPLRQASA